MKQKQQTVVRRTTGPGIAWAATAALVAGMGTPAGAAPVTDGPDPAAAKAQKVRVDVDGDSAKDVVRVRANKRRCAVKVKTAAGAKGRLRWRAAAPNACRLHGAAQVDGVAGAEIVVLAEQGAHTSFYRMLTWRDGDLVWERAPRRAGMEGLWVTDGAVNFDAGIRGKANGRLVTTRVMRAKGSTFKGKRLVTKYRNGAWKVTGATKVRMSAKKAKRAAGWHVPGLPRWTR